MSSDQLALPESIVASYPPDKLGLFNLIRPNVSDDMLKVIANCDYGENCAENLIELRLLRDGTSLDQPMDWIPNEVLCLFRWSELGNGPNLDTDRNFHIARAFCCCCLLLVPDVNANRRRFEIDSVLPLIESISALDQAHRSALCGFLVWIQSEMDLVDEEFLFGAFALLASLSKPQEVHAMGNWLIAANDVIMPRHCTDFEPDLKVFTDLRYGVLFPVKLQRFVDRLITRIDQEGELVQFLRQL
ncbi:MAG: hypothetical protein ABL949_11510 [Fimbriimonadaceae bacterium]